MLCILLEIQADVNSSSLVSYIEKRKLSCAVYFLGNSSA